MGLWLHGINHGEANWKSYAWVFSQVFFIQNMQNAADLKTTPLIGEHLRLKAKLAAYVELPVPLTGL